MTWGHAVDVFDELDRRGLNTTSAIERAYQQDSALMWRLVACLCKISYLAGHLWERFTEIMSWSEYYRPYFKRYRVGKYRFLKNRLIFCYRHLAENRGSKSTVRMSGSAGAMRLPWTMLSSKLLISLPLINPHSSITW
jgi:hypothetical protein